MNIKRKVIFSRFGRKSKLSKMSENELKSLFQMVEDGIPFTTVGDFFGISKNAIYKYIRKGDVFIDSPDHLRNPNHEQYAAFSYYIKRSRARYFYKLIKSINNTSSSNECWKRDFRILSVRDKKNWGPGASRFNIEEQVAPDLRFL